MSNRYANTRMHVLMRTKQFSSIKKMPPAGLEPALQSSQDCVLSCWTMGTFTPHVFSEIGRNSKPLKGGEPSWHKINLNYSNFLDLTVAQPMCWCYKTTKMKAFFFSHLIWILGFPVSTAVSYFLYKVTLSDRYIAIGFETWFIYASLYVVVNMILT